MAGRSNFVAGSRTLEVVPTVYGPSRATAERLRAMIASAVVSGALAAQVASRASDVLAVCALLADDNRTEMEPLALRDRIFHTTPHRELFGLLGERVAALARGDFLGRNGSQSATIVGAKGIGKSVSLEAFTDVCMGVHSDVISVMVSYYDVHSVGSRASQASLFGVIVTNLVQRKFIDTSELPRPPYSESLSALLQRKQKRLLILVDEVDELYRVDPSTPLGALCMSTLSDLAFLGQTTSGRYCTFICGSSGAIPFLITRSRLGPRLKEEFLLAHGAPNLNGQKFSTVRIKSSLPTHLDAVRAILNQPQMTSEVARLFAFCAETTARSVDKVRTTASDDKTLESLAADESMQGWGTLQDDSLGMFLDGLLKKMRSKNADLVRALVKDKQLDFNAVMTTDWEVQFEPCTFEEAREIYGALHRPREGQTVEPLGNIIDDVLLLCDKSWVVMDSVEKAAPGRIYPTSLIQVLKLEMEQTAIAAARTTISANIVKAVKDFVPPVVSVARASAAVATLFV